MNFFVSNEIALFDLGVVHGFLKGAYWCEGIPREVVMQAMQNSLAFGVFKEVAHTQLGELTPVQVGELTPVQVGELTPVQVGELTPVQVGELTPVQVGELTPVQVGYARVITDKTTFAYLADVFILPEYRGNGLGKLLMQHILAHTDLQNLRRFLLATKDAHGLYKQFGFTGLAKPQSILEILKPNPYLSGDAL